MKILVFGGSGKIGTAVAWDLVKEDDVETVGLVGRRAEALDKTKSWIGSPKLKSHVLDIDDTQTLKSVMKEYDVGVIALPDRRTSYHVAQAAIEAGLNIVDMLEEFHRTPDAYEIEGLRIPEGMTVDNYGEWLHQKAVERGVTFFDGAGFAPGISNITVGEGIRKLDERHSQVWGDSLEGFCCQASAQIYDHLGIRTCLEGIHDKGEGDKKRQDCGSGCSHRPGSF
jgi:saccharopine dehydrogenase-like NADP-dependent oxidoreductase